MTPQPINVTAMIANGNPSSLDESQALASNQPKQKTSSANTTKPASPAIMMYML